MAGGGERQCLDLGGRSKARLRIHGKEPKPLSHTGIPGQVSAPSTSLLQEEQG